LKNREAARTRHARELARGARRRVILTGTPVLNRPSELWSLLNILAPSRWPNFYRFAHRYCAPVRTSWGWDFRGSSNREELAQELRRGLLLRRRKKHVLAQLPPIVRQVIPLAVDSSPLLEHLTRRVAELYGFDPAHPPFEIDPEKIPFELISEIRRETGALKVEAANRVVLYMLDGVYVGDGDYWHKQVALILDISFGVEGIHLQVGSREEDFRNYFE